MYRHALKRPLSNYAGAMYGRLKRSRYRISGYKPYRRSGGYPIGSKKPNFSRRRLIWKGESFMPEVFYTSFKYNSTFPDTDADGFHGLVYRGNSLYDPDSGAGGDYPLGFTTMINTYARYNVISASINVEVANNDTDDPLIVAVFPSRESTAIGIAQDDIILQQPHCKHALITAGGSGGQVFNYQLTKDMFGFKDTDDVSLNAAYNANPTAMWYWHVYLFNKSTAANALNCLVSVHIKYYVKMSYLRNLSFDVS